GAGSGSPIPLGRRSSVSYSMTRASQSATAASSHSTAMAGYPTMWRGADGPRGALQPDQAAAHRLDDRLGPGRSAELHHHAVDVELCGVIADAEAIGDQLVRQALGE